MVTLFTLSSSLIQLTEDHTVFAAVACALFERLQPTTINDKQIPPSDSQAVSVPGRNLASVSLRAPSSPSIRAAMPAATTLRPITKVSTFSRLSAERRHHVPPSPALLLAMMS